jgi:hypothetical protein
MMSRRRAPSALRMPISRVRSETATSMMFMMTIEPTIRPMAGQRGAEGEHLPLDLVEERERRVARLKRTSSGSPGDRLRRVRRRLARDLLQVHQHLAGRRLQRDSPRRQPRGSSRRERVERYGAMASRRARSRTRCPAADDP